MMRITESSERDCARLGLMAFMTLHTMKLKATLNDPFLRGDSR
jgi:hypothetical protein